MTGNTQRIHARNKIAALDAAWTPLLHVVAHSRGASERGRSTIR
jgi:hypothetical protein